MSALEVRNLFYLREGQKWMRRTAEGTRKEKRDEINVNGTLTCNN